MSDPQPKVPHLPWAPSKLSDSADGVTMGVFMPPIRPGFFFKREKWPYGGFITIGACLTCRENYQSGGQASERNLLRWAVNHECNFSIIRPEYDFETAEGDRLFR